MKINNKGMTLVELLVTFSLLLIIVVGLYNLILEVKFQIEDKQIAKDTIEYSSLINNEIHYNLLIDKPFAVAINETGSEWACYAAKGTCVKTDDGMKISVTSPTGKNNAPQISSLNSSCKGVFPCSYYFYINSSGGVSYKIIALNKDNPDNVNESLRTKGILYGESTKPIFEPVPNNDYIEIRDADLTVAGSETTIKGNKPYIKVTDEGVLTINYGLYVIDGDQNYGFKIAYPNGFK